MYKQRLKTWGLEKNIKKTESIAMLRIEEQRRSENKKTRFIRRGKPVELGKLRRFARRHKLTAEGAINALSGEHGIYNPHTLLRTPDRLG